MSYVVLAASVALLLMMGKRKKTPWYVIVLLAAIAGASLAQTGLGSWLANVLSSLFGFAGNMVGVGTAMIAGVVMLILAITTVYDVAIDRRADKPAQIGLVLLPLLFLVAAGPIAEGGSTLYDHLGQLGQTTLTEIAGG